MGLGLLLGGSHRVLSEFRRILWGLDGMLVGPMGFVQHLGRSHEIWTAFKQVR